MANTTSFAPLVIDSAGVRRYSGTELLERADWDDIVVITILTTDEGPWQEDFFWLLHQSDGTGCCVPGDLAQDHGLLPALQARYGDAFDNEQVIRASGCTEDAAFICWRNTNGDHAAA